MNEQEAGFVAGPINVDEVARRAQVERDRAMARASVGAGFLSGPFSSSTPEVPIICGPCGHVAHYIWLSLDDNSDRGLRITCRFCGNAREFTVSEGLQGAEKWVT